MREMEGMHGNEMMIIEFIVYNILQSFHLKGVLHLLPQKAPKCFVLYLKIINIFLKTNIVCIL